MTRRSWARWIRSIAICAILTHELIAPAPALLQARAAEASDPSQSPAGREIARLREGLPPEQLERLNAALFFLVRQYEEGALYALLKGADAATVIARGEVEAHLAALSRARLALTLYYGDSALVAKATEGMSEDEIIAHAQALR